MEGAVEFDRIFISSHRHDVSFVWMKNHFPSYIAGIVVHP
jgi:hypothetical protein